MYLLEIFKGLRATALGKISMILKIVTLNFILFVCSPFNNRKLVVIALEPPLFLKIVELFKEVVVHLLKLYKLGIPLHEEEFFQQFSSYCIKGF